jgi:alpha-aminoadipate carrier protein LysW
MQAQREGGLRVAECPECAASVSLKDAVQGEILPCPECGADLEVVSLTPTPKLALAPQEEEDWGE